MVTISPLSVIATNELRVFCSFSTRFFFIAILEKKHCSTSFGSVLFRLVHDRSFQIKIFKDEKKIQSNSIRYKFDFGCDVANDLRLHLHRNTIIWRI